MTDVLEAFAKGLEEARLSSGDPFEILTRYGETAEQVSIELSERGVEGEELDTAILETRLWQLALLLFDFRAHSAELDQRDSVSVYPFSSDAVVQEAYLRANPQSRANWLILGWLQQNLDRPAEPEDSRAVKWMHTKLQIQGQGLNSLRGGMPAGVGGGVGGVGSSGIVSKLDADAPLREAKPIASEDETYDSVFFKYIFDLLLGGNWDTALEACERTGNLSLKLALAGVNDYIDPDVDGPSLQLDANVSESKPEGSKNKPLWRRMCYQLSQAPGVNNHEKAIYGFLAGDLGSVLPLCDSWETQFIAYMNHITATEAEVSLIESGRLDLKLDAPVSGITSPTAVLDVLAHSSSAVVKAQSENLLRNLIGAIINDTVGLIAGQLGEELERITVGAVDSSELLDRPEILRITTHLVLFLQQLGYQPGYLDGEALALIISAYVEMLRQRDRDLLVPIYIAYLPDSIATTTYSFLLANITDGAQRKQHLALGRKYKINMDECVRTAVDRVFSETASIYDPAHQESSLDISDHVSDTDLRLYRTAEWFVDASLWPDAVHSTVHLYRRFLQIGHVESARQYGNRVSSEFLLKRYNAVMAGRHSGPDSLSDAERMELNEYDRLVKGLNCIAEWKSHYSQVSPATNSSGKAAVVSAKSVSKDWQTTGLAIINNAYTTILDVAKDWMITTMESYGPDGQEHELIVFLRTNYIPHLLLGLLEILTEGQTVHRQFLVSAVQLATKISSDQDRIYELFQQGGYLELLLSKLTAAYVDGIEDGESGIFETN